MWTTLGRVVAEHPWRVIAAWMVAITVLAVTAPSKRDVNRIEPRSLLPQDTLYNQSLDLERRAFPQLASRTRTVLVFEAIDRLAPEHVQYLTRLSNKLVDAVDDAGLSVQSPFLNPLIAPRLMSADGQSAMIAINSDTNYLTQRSVDQVNQIDALARDGLPDELRYELTGEGGLGRDLVAVSEAAFRRTTKVTLAALIVILALVYRAPIAASAPLVAIGSSVVAALYLLSHMTRLGWGLGAIEKTLVVVLLFGSGTDYALFWISSFRERFGELADAVRAAIAATADVGPAIFGSAATTIGGVLMLVFADLLPSHNAGRSLALALSVSLFAALTLIPAFAVVTRRVLFWPFSSVTPRTGRARVRGFWQRVGNGVSQRPVATLIALLLPLGVFAWLGWHATYTYDALGVIPDQTGTARGRAMLERHFRASQLFSWNLMIQSPAIGDDTSQAALWSEQLQRRIIEVDGAVDVWSIAAPLGRDDPVSAAAATSWARDRAAAFYVSPTEHVMRFEIMQDSPALSSRAMYECEQVLSIARDWSAQKISPDAVIRATGLTPYILDVRAVADADHLRVVTLVIVAILVIVTLILRRVTPALIILCGSLLAYLATVGLTSLFFVHVTGAEGIDWKVRLFSFVILVAVGQDYGIFVITRLYRQRETQSPAAAVRGAMSKSGAVVTSCGLIMAATMGSLGATGLPFFQELGMAFGVGVMIDAVLICAIGVPATQLVIDRCIARRQPFESTDA